MPGELIVEGLDEIVRDLRSLDRTLPRAVSRGFKDTLTAHTLRAARRNLAGLGHVPNKQGAITVFATQREAGLKLRVSRYPWIAGAEFGAHRYRQFMPWVGNQYTGTSNFPGYAVGTALRATIDIVDRDMLDVIAESLGWR